MPRQTPEADRKVFKALRAVALERFCHRVLNETGGLLGDSSRSPYDRYRDLFQLIQRRDRELASAFDAPRRSQAFFQPALMTKLGLLEPDEIARLTPATRDIVAQLTDAVRPPRESNA